MTENYFDSFYCHLLQLTPMLIFMAIIVDNISLYIIIVLLKVIIIIIASILCIEKLRGAWGRDVVQAKQILVRMLNTRVGTSTSMSIYSA